MPRSESAWAVAAPTAAIFAVPNARASFPADRRRSNVRETLFALVKTTQS
jgi:hypothetical protein